MAKCNNPEHTLSNLMTEEEWDSLGNEAFGYAQIAHAMKHENEVPENPVPGDFYLDTTGDEIRMLIWTGKGWSGGL